MKNQTNTTHTSNKNCRVSTGTKNKMHRHSHGRRPMIQFMLLGLIMISIFAFSANVMAGNQRNESSYTYYKSIQIQDGDTLWSIASEYAPSTSMSVNEYIKEIKKMNHLTTDKITAEQYLSVFYCSSEYK